jgi:hypothetical protein
LETNNTRAHTLYQPGSATLIAARPTSPKCLIGKRSWIYPFGTAWVIPASFAAHAHHVDYINCVRDKKQLNPPASKTSN